jgi:hypothetical protein
MRSRKSRARLESFDRDAADGAAADVLPQGLDFPDHSLLAEKAQRLGFYTMLLTAIWATDRIFDSKSRIGRGTLAVHAKFSPTIALDLKL